MYKKMKGVSIDPLTYGAYEDANARFKRQALMQDYRELQKEAEAVRNKLEGTKQRKLTLLAEVRFLRRRYKYLVENKAVKHQQGRRKVQQPNFATQQKDIVKQKTYDKKKGNLQKTVRQKPGNYTVSNANQREQIFSGKDLASRNSNPVLDLNQKDRIHSGREAIHRNLTPFFDLNQKERSHVRKEAAFRNRTPVLDLNQKERLYAGKETVPRNPFPAFDLNQMGRNIASENAVQSQAPIFDLNLISGEEEELRDDYEPLKVEPPKKFVVRGGSGTDDQHSDLKLSICRNVGNGSNQAGKRKISWQDPVALEV